MFRNSFRPRDKTQSALARRGVNEIANAVPDNFDDYGREPARFACVKVCGFINLIKAFAPIVRIETAQRGQSTKFAPKRLPTDARSCR